MRANIYPQSRKKENTVKKGDNLSTSLDMGSDTEQNIEDNKQGGQLGQYYAQDSAQNTSQSDFVAQEGNYWNEDEYTQESFQEDYHEPVETAMVASSQSLSNTEQESEEQMDFGIEAARTTRVDLIRKGIRRWENIVQVLPFWKSEVIMVNIAFTVITVIALLALIILTFSSLPTKVPLFYQQVDNNWILIDKSIFIFIVIGLTVIEFVLIRLKRAIFNFDRRLSSVMAVTQTFFNVLVIIAFLQLISLLLI